MSIQLNSHISADDAYQRFNFTPNPMQREMFERIMAKDGCALLLKAPTSSGKSESVLIPTLAAGRRIFMIYPTLSLIEDQEERVAGMLCTLSEKEKDRPFTSLVVDTGAMMYRRMWRDGKVQRERRHLYHADVVLTSLDKFLYRFFGFGETKKGYTFPFRLRYGRRPLFCFDEAHSYEDVAFTNFVDLVRVIGFEANPPRDIVVMTATMPAAYQEQLVPALLDVVDYTQGTPQKHLNEFYQARKERRSPQKYLHFQEEVEIEESEEESEPHDRLQQALLAAIATYHQPGRRTIVVTESVRRAAALFEVLRQRQVANLELYHGRQTHEIRRKTYRRLKERDAGGSYLLITTSAIEVGCDLDAHSLITQLCNPEQLTQRAGRCNRRGAMPDARVIVIGDKIPSYTRTLHPFEDEAYQALLRNMSGGLFEPTMLAELRRHPAAIDVRARMMFTMLYEYVYEAERANKPLHDRGLVFTRSWEPTITLTTKIHMDGRLENSLQMPVTSCMARRAEDLTPGCVLYVARFDEDKRRDVYEPVKYGTCAYMQDLVLVVPPDFHLDLILGYVDLPKAFVRRGKDGYRQRFSRPAGESLLPEIQEDEQQTISSNGELWWWYLDHLPTLSEEAATENIPADAVEEPIEDEDDDDA